MPQLEELDVSRNALGSSFFHALSEKDAEGRPVGVRGLKSLTAVHFSNNESALLNAEMQPISKMMYETGGIDVMFGCRFDTQIEPHCVAVSTRDRWNPFRLTEESSWHTWQVLTTADNTMAEWIGMDAMQVADLGFLSLHHTYVHVAMGELVWTSYGYVPYNGKNTAPGWCRPWEELSAGYFTALQSADPMLNT